MFSLEKQKQVAFNMVMHIITNLGHLQNDTGMIIGRKENKIQTYAAYEAQEIETGIVKMVPIYDGIRPERAAEKYIELLGPIEAMKEAVYYLRNAGRTIEWEQ